MPINFEFEFEFRFEFEFEFSLSGVWSSLILYDYQFHVIKEFKIMSFASLKIIAMKLNLLLIN